MCVCVCLCVENLRLDRTKPVASKKSGFEIHTILVSGTHASHVTFVGGTQKNWAYRQHDTPYPPWGGMRDDFG